MLALLLATHDLFITTHSLRKNLRCSQPISSIDKQGFIWFSEILSCSKQILVCVEHHGETLV